MVGLAGPGVDSSADAQLSPLEGFDSPAVTGGPDHSAAESGAANGRWVR